MRERNEFIVVLIRNVAGGDFYHPQIEEESIAAAIYEFDADCCDDAVVHHVLRTKMKVDLVLPVRPVKFLTIAFIGYHPVRVLDGHGGTSGDERAAYEIHQVL